MAEYTEEQINQAKEILAKSKPRFSKRVEYGALVGAVLTMLAAGYKQNTIDAYLNSEKAAKQFAGEIMQARDKRNLLEKTLGLEEKPAPVPVGKKLFTKKGADGLPVEIGKGYILKKSPKYLKLTPSVPLTAKTGKMVLYGAGAGALLGSVSWVKKKHKRFKANRLLKRLNRR